MSFVLNINSVDLSDQLVPKSLKITDVVDSKVNTCKFQIEKISTETKPEEGQEIVITKDSVKLFAGFLTSCREEEIGEADLLIYNVTAVDYTHYLQRKKVAENYQDKTLKEIIEDIVSNYVDSSVTTNNVSTGPTIASINFSYIPPTACFDKLAEATNYSWYIDYDKDVHFFKREDNPAPEELTEDSLNWRNLAITPNISQLRNRVYVRGGKYLSDEQTQSFEADGHEDVWWLKAKPVNLTIEEDSVSKTVGVENLHDEIDYDYMMNYEEKSIRRVAGNPTGGTVIECKFKYYIRVLVEVLEESSITAMQALNLGGDGVYDHFINDDSILTKEEARKRAEADLADYSDPIIEGQFETTTSALESGNLFRSGQILTINIPSRGLDNSYLIQKVVTKSINEENYVYEIHFGGRLLGLIDFLKGIAEKEIYLDADEVVEKVKTIREEVSISESITKYSDKQVSETVTIAENVRKNPFNPPDWVLAYHTPTSDTDSKRNGRLGISMYLY
jgi:hypothetical protein